MPDVGAIRAGKAAVEITGDDAQLREATQRSKKYLQELGESAKHAGGAVEKGFLGRLAAAAKEHRKERRASGESALESAISSGRGLTGLAADSLGIGLPVMVTEAIGTKFKELTDKAMELRSQLREGKITSEEMVRSLATGIPVLGDFVAGFLNIREMITGEKEAIDELNKEAERTVRISDSQTRAAKVYRDTLNEIHHAAQRTNLATRAVGKDEFTQARVGIAESRLDLDFRRKEGGKGKAEEYAQAMAPAIKAMQEELAGLDRKIEELDEDDPARGALEAERTDSANRLRDLRARVETGKRTIIADTAAALNAEGRKIDAEAAEVERRYTQAWEDAGKSAATALAHAQSEGAAERLRLPGRDHDAELILLRQALAEQIAAIDKATEDELKRFGITSRADPRLAQVTNQANQQKTALTGNERLKEAGLDQREADKRRREVETLTQLKLQAIANVHQRELALLDARYRYEYDQAKLRPGDKDPKVVADQWKQARANLLAEQAHAQADSAHELDVDIERARNQIEKRGLRGRLADLEIERRERLRAEHDPRTTTGVSDAKVNELFDLRRQMELMSSRSAAGSFSARELSRMGATGTHLDQIARATKDTANNTRRALDQKPAFSQ